MSVYSWLNQRNLGLCTYKADTHNGLKPFIFSDILRKQLCLWKLLYRKHDDATYDSYVGHGGIFGLKYSPDGRMVVAACEKDAVVVIDPLTSKTVLTRERVHTKRCNTVTFIDDRLFATCSDDSNICIWDIRSMKEEVQMLRGHQGWVKNIEYHRPTKKLVSSGFDDQIMAWDINNLLPNGECDPELLLYCHHLMRMKLSPDGQSMYISAIQTADLIAIHNLNLDKLSDDVEKIEWDEGISDVLQLKSHQLAVDRDNCFDEQSQPISRQNQVELYYGYAGNERNLNTVVFCQSIDVHPDNMAVVMRYDWLPYRDFKFVSVHNTWSYYDGPSCGNNLWVSHGKDNCLPLPRGQTTNFTPIIGVESAEYIHEVTFSQCGRLIAAPAGYGVGVFTYNERLDDYQTHITSRLAGTHQWPEGGDRVMPSHADVEAKQLFELVYCCGHKSVVLSAAFSPNHMQIATGSKHGQIILFEPVL